MAPGKKTRPAVDVDRSTVTDIRIDNGNRLIAHAVDQDVDGTTLASHDLTIAREDPALPDPVGKAIDTITGYVQKWADKA